MLWLGKDDRTNPPGDGARHQEGGSGLHDGHGSLQPRAHAQPGTTPSGGGVKKGEGAEMASSPAQTHLKQAIWPQPRTLRR